MGGDVDAYGYLAYNRFFPVDRAGPAADDGQGDHARSQRGPDRSGRQRGSVRRLATGVGAGPGRVNYLDIPSKRIYRMYAYASLNHDPAFLKQAYPP